MFNSLALAFIISTKLSTLPPIYSAIATQPSLADATAIPFNKVSTFWTSPASRNIWLPPIDDAVSLTVTSSVNFILLLSTASHIKSIVITFVTLAGGNFSWQFFSYNTLPLVTSISTADLHFRFKFAPFLSANTRVLWLIISIIAKNTPINFFIMSPLQTIILYIVYFPKSEIYN